MLTHFDDPFGRKFTSLRISLTQICNFSCHYCVPENFRPDFSLNEMRPEEFKKLVDLLKEVLPLEKLRITGGEPLIYRGFDPLLELLNESGFKEISVTTNAAILEKKVPVLKKCGVRRINVSLDTLQEKEFKDLTRGGNLRKVLRGIEAAIEAGIRVKLNMVLMRTWNRDQILPVLRYCLERGIECRYIELMKMGHVSRIFEENFIPMQEVLDEIASEFSFEKIQGASDATAVLFQIKEGGFFGIIPNESVPFCAGCSRLRLTSTGELFGCLTASKSFPVRKFLEYNDREEAKETLKQILINAMKTKQTQFYGSETLMQTIGG